MEAGDPPPSKRSRIETEADRQEALGAAMLSAVAPARAIDVLRARLDPDAPETIALVMLQAGFPFELIEPTIQAYEKSLDPVDVMFGASFELGTVGSDRVYEFRKVYEVSPFATVSEVVKRVQEDASMHWLVPSRSDDPFADIEDEDYATSISVYMYPEGAIGSGSPLFDSATGEFTASPNSKVLIYTKSLLPSPFVDPGADVTVL